ncbi:multiple PDZ domain protein isoform X3 [Leptinotarsa decemlineata]|uniref:multiple PDZ domain protein isoform X3 n=1 Tax=Leptinotarsa decemlineata TaxID=7539 RepID=UPI003D307BD6
MVLNTEWAQVEVIDLINDGTGLAFGIIGGRSTGVVVKTILPGGVADRDGRLQSGDHILQIGEVNLRGLGSEQVASVLRQCGVHVRMVVARPVESANADFQTLGSLAPIVPTKILGDPVELDKHLIENGYSEAFAYHPSPSTFNTDPYLYTEHHPDSIQVHGMIDPFSVPYITRADVQNNLPKMLSLDVSLHETELPETETYTVKLKKDDLGLGITVAGYVCEKEEISGIFVKSISKGSAADLNKNIKINDRIVEVNGVSVIGFTNHQAVETLRNTGPVVEIKLETYLRGPKYEQLQQAIRANELRPPSPPSPTLTSLLKVPLSQVQMDHLTIEPDGESRTSFEFDSAILLEAITPVNEAMEIVIGGEMRSLQFSLESHEIIYEKWKEKLNSEVEIVIAQMQKGTTNGLGISLEGTVDVEAGKEVRPHHYIRNILPDGPVGRNGVLQSGDELLEVNGIQLLGLNHLEVVSILKQLPNVVNIVCARYPVPIRIIDTSQHREAFQTRKIFAGSLQTLVSINESNHLVKAKSETSIASSMASEAISRSRSLEMIAGLPMWSDEPTIVELVKNDHGLGFSILDYQDPLNTKETVIVIRSLVPGGAAQNDGRLIPGDRLLAVNDIDVEHATLDRAVQVLKTAPKGIVKITVAKPLNTNDGMSHASQDTEEDQTCLEDFQECIEDFQECLDVVHICIDDDNSFNHSACSSQVEDFGQKSNCSPKNCASNNFVETNYLNIHRIKSRDSIGDSDIDISFKSTNEAQNDKISEYNKGDINKIEKFAKNDSLTLSDKPSVSEKDDYETCVDDSLSEEYSRVKKQFSKSIETDSHSGNQTVQNFNSNHHKKLCSNDLDDTTPTNSKNNLLDQFFVHIPDAKAHNTVKVAVSEPCLMKDFFTTTRHICLDSKMDDDGLKSYDNHSEDHGDDEFFLVQYPTKTHKEVCKSLSDSNVLETHEIPLQRVYRKCVEEYYNDYADCLEMYNLALEKENENVEGTSEEMNDDDIFIEIFLPFKSRSAPDIMDSSFVMLTYDPGPDMNRRKSAFIPGYQCHESEMTVIRPIETDLKGCHVEDMLQKHWGSTHTVKVYREPNKSLGINIVGGKVDLHSSEKSPDALLGIFVKHVVADSPAGKTGKFKTGDRILEVSGIDLREASHEKAVQAIRNATNPVIFVIQSLIPWNFSETELNDKNNESVAPSPCPQSVTPEFSPQSEILKNDEENHENESEYQNDLHMQNCETSEDVSRKKFTETATLKESCEVDLVPLVAEVTPVYAPESIDEVKAEPPASGFIYDEQDEKESEDKNESPLGSDDDEEEDVRELEGRTVSSKGYQIDRASAGNVKRTKEEIANDTEDEDDFGYTTNKVKKKYANLGHTILMVQLERSSQGLGLSLAGHKDRNCMAVFVCGLNPKGAAFKAGSIQIGDEILEVNGVVLHGRCHLNASAIIKGLSGPTFRVIILRRKTAIDDIAVRPITQFPVSLAEEQGNQSLGIMIIEGKHAEVGQGIFISDIQESSSAEKAGLEIGEMILAVNKDSLVGSNYETAANLLKRTEGLVTLVVSNPGKKDPNHSHSPTPTISANSTIVENNKNAVTKPATLKPTAPPSRPTTPVPEPVGDPLTCQIVPGRDITIEIVTENKGLGLFFVGGKDTLIPKGIVIVEVYSGGMADKDKRLQPGDQILEVNGTTLKDVSYTTALQSLRQTLPKMKMIVYRPNTIEYTPVEVDLIKKPGKGLGLSVLARKSGKGVYIADIVNGGTADLDGRIVKGDLIISVNGQNIEEVSGEEAGAILKTVVGRVSLKLHRYKPVVR